MPLNSPPRAALLLAVAAVAVAVADPEVRATVLSIGDGDTIRGMEGANRSLCAWPATAAQQPDGDETRPRARKLASAEGSAKAVSTRECEEAVRP